LKGHSFDLIVIPRDSIVVKRSKVFCKRAKKIIANGFFSSIYKYFQQQKHKAERKEVTAWVSKIICKV
jgi:hypothetical protein